jgi:hypothetical protein
MEPPVFLFFSGIQRRRKRINVLVRFLKGKPTTRTRESMVECGVGIHSRRYV